MKNLTLLFFILLSSFTFSQKITGIILDFETKKPIERAHIFFINETIYSDQKGEFSFNLKGKKSIDFSVSHIKYTTKKVTYLKTELPPVIFLEQKQETLEGFDIYASKKLENSISFTRLKNMPKGAYSFGSVLNNNKIYVFGGDTSSQYEKNKEGLSQVQIGDETEIMRFLTKPKPISFSNYIGHIQTYDISKKEWNIEEDKITKRAYFNAVSYKDKVFLMGGKMLSKTKSRELLANEIEVVSLTDFNVKKDRTNPHQAVDFGTVLYDDKILSFGGSTKQHTNGRFVYSNDVHVYDVKTGFWHLMAKMPSSKEVPGIIFGDKLYFFGGYKNKNLTAIESFNLKTGRWKKEGKLFRAMKNPAITKDNEFIYIQEKGKILTFDPKMNILNEYIIDLSLHNSKMHFFNENLYIIGGYHSVDFRKFPSSGFYKIEVAEFFKTKPFKSKVLN